MADNDDRFKLGEGRALLPAFGFQEIGNGLSGEPDPVEGEILGNQATPTGGAEFDGGQGVAHGSLPLPVKGFFLHGIDVANKKNPEKRNHGAKN